MRASGSVRVGVVLAAGMLAILSGRIQAQEPGKPSDQGRARGILVEESRNDSPSFLVRVGVDRPDRTYRVGDEMHVTVSSERDGYLYLIYLDASKNYSCLFPNRVQNNNLIKAGSPSAVVPQPDASFRLRVSPPVGQEVLKAIVTLKPLEQLQLEALTRGDFTALSTEQVKAINVEVKGTPNGWAEHFVDVITVPAEGGTPGAQQPGTQPPSKSSRRVGLFVGISQYKDPKIPGLTICHKDAQSMAEVMQQQGRLEDFKILVNDQATRQNIEQSLCTWLPQVTKPGDTVVVYWSGHGGRCADTQNRHTDGYVEYLVPSDGSLDDSDSIQKSMILDDTFGRWLQYLDGRRVAIILDTCHSGGQAKGGPKGVSSVKSMRPTTWGTHFLTTLSRTKNIGQKEMALLASSTASQVSFERTEGDYSVMTYYLLAQLRQGTGPIALPELYNGVKDKVVQYVEANFPGSAQTPVLVDYTTPPMYIRP